MVSGRDSRYTLAWQLENLHQFPGPKVRKDGRNAKSLEQDKSVAPATAGMEPSGNRSLLWPQFSKDNTLFAASRILTQGFRWHSCGEDCAISSQENLRLQGTLHQKMVNTGPAAPKRWGHRQRSSCSVTAGPFLLLSSAFWLFRTWTLDLSLTILFFSLFNLIHPNLQNTNKTGHFSPFLHLPLHQDYVSLFIISCLDHHSSLLNGLSALLHPF